jgi:predicted Rossmann-fold nucleotide-binding protein
MSRCLMLLLCLILSTNAHAGKNKKKCRTYISGVSNNYEGSKSKPESTEEPKSSGGFMSYIGSWLSSGPSSPKDRDSKWDSEKKWDSEEYKERQKKSEAERKERELKAEAERKEREQRARSEIKAILEKPDRLQTLVADQLLYEWVGQWMNGETVTLLTGNSAVLNTQGEKVLDSIVRRLTDAGVKVVYDADALTAKTIQQAGGARTLGITSDVTKTNDQNMIVGIENDYLRMQAFAKGKRVIATPDSRPGFGMWLEGKLSYAFGVKSAWVEGYGNWKSNASPDLGLGRGYGSGVREYSNEVNDLMKYLKDELRFASDSPTLSPKRVDRIFLLGKLVEQMSGSDLNSIIGRARLMLSGEKAMASDSSGEAIPGGAVIFGSGSGHWMYEKLVYNTAYFLGSLGIPVATGGAGGFMRTANSGAYDAGAQSIGIPMTGRSSLDTERRTYSSEQTLTVPADGYESRIPMLLNRRELVIIAPGGGGTLKELATALVGDYRIILLGEYYQKLYQWLQGSALPESYKENIIYIANESDLANYVEKLRSQMTAEQLNNLQARQTPQSRKARRDFEGEAKAKEEKSKLWDFKPKKDDDNFWD